MKNEHMVIKNSPAALGFRLFMIVFLIDTVYALLFIIFFYFGSLDVVDFSNTVNTGFIVFLWIAHTLKFIVIAYFLLKFLADYMQTDYIITKTHLTVEAGLINTKTYQYELTQLKEINVTQGPMGRALHYGDIELQFGALGFHKNVILREVTHPHRYQRELKNFLDH